MRLVLAAAAVLPLLAAAAPSLAAAPFIQPGEAVSTPVGGCTLNFVFDGVGALAGKVYVGIAAHCVRLGDGASTSAFPGFGTTTYRGAYGGEAARTEDFAFIEVKPQFAPSVNAAVKGHPAFPTGFTREAETDVGDLVQLSGYGMGFSTTAQTREGRVGVLYGDTPREFRAEAPTVFGDSGGPVVHVPTGKALGIVSGLNVPDAGTLRGPTVEDMLRLAAEDGFTVQLRTA